MSQAYYQEIWKETQNDLRRTLVQDANVKKKGPYPDPNTAKRLVGHLFMKYVKIVNRLDDCYDQMIHPQKREVIGRLLDLSLGRLLELKSEIVRIELDDYCFFDNVLIELKMTHQDMQIKVPKYFWRDREKDKQHRRELIKLVFQEAEREKFKEEFLKNVPEDYREEAWAKHLASEERERIEREKYEQQRKLLEDKEEDVDSLKQIMIEMKKPVAVDKEAVKAAISLIQRHERARQGRTQAVLAKRYLFIKTWGESAKIPEEEGNKAAKVIQRHWRRHRRRMKEIKDKARLDEVLGVTPAGGRDMSKFKKIEDVARIRRKMQDRNQAEYEEALVKIKEKVAALYSVPMEEDTVDEIIGWFRWFFEQTNYLPDFPPEKPVIPTGEVMGVPKKLGPQFYDRLFPKSKTNKSSPAKNTKTNSLAIALSGIAAIGGSALVVAGHWIGPKEFLVCQAELEKRKKAGKTGNKEKGEKMSKEEKAALKKKAKEAEKRRLLAEEALGFQMRESGFLVPLNKADRDYRTTWMDLDERKNYEQRYVYEFIKNNECYELSIEVRKAVDEMMVLELDILKDALERDKNPKKKKKKKKKKGKKKEKKKKEKKDPTGDRTLDDLFLELFKNGIIRDYEEVYLKDYNGERSFAAFDMRQKLIDWPPSTGDVRELILQLCILPLGSSRIHQLSPLIKSICIMGAENSGKEFLARIVCTETASVVFDLTPENVVGKYPGKDGLKMLQHLIEKMARALQPSIIFVDGAQKTFYKKVPKEEKQLEPKRLANMIKKILKGIKPPDQILVLGVSSQPWVAQKRAFLKAYQKIIFVPQMDYGSYLRIWQDLMLSYKSIPNDFDVSSLARVSWGYSVKAIMDAVSNVMTPQRISISKVKPFKQEEFLEELLKVKPTDEKLKEKCFKFYASTELPKKRAKRLAQLKEEMEKPKK